jgi:hypothetical protein
LLVHLDAFQVLKKRNMAPPSGDISMGAFSPAQNQSEFEFSLHPGDVLLPANSTSGLVTTFLYSTLHP